MDTQEVTLLLLGWEKVGHAYPGGGFARRRVAPDPPETSIYCSPIGVDAHWVFAVSAEAALSYERSIGRIT